MSRLLAAEPRFVLVAGKGRVDLCRRVYQRLNNVLPTLWLASEPDGFPAGRFSLFCPSFPLLREVAIRSAAKVFVVGDEAAPRFGAPIVIKSEAELKISLSTDAVPPRHAPDALMETSWPVACMSDEKYLPHLLGLMQNLLIKEEAFFFHVLALDNLVEEFFAKYPFFPVRVHRLSDIWNYEEFKRITFLPPRDRAFISKPAFLKRVHAEAKRSFLYTDLDLFFYESPSRLFERLGEARVLLFPHYARSIEHAKKYGVFNAGLLLVGETGGDFLTWWRMTCFTAYQTDPSRYYYVDQGFLDLAPALFDGVRIYRERDENVGPWSLCLAQPRSFHAAYADQARFFEAKHAWDQLCLFFSPLINEPNFSFDQQIWLQQSAHAREASRLYFLSRLVPSRWVSAIYRAVVRFNLENLFDWVISQVRLARGVSQ